MSKGLNEKQKRFCHEYIKDFNATQAAIRSKYSKKTAYSIGQQHLNKFEIQSCISKLIKSREIRTQVTQDRVLLEIARLAFNDPRKAFDQDNELLPINEWPDDVAATISSIKIAENIVGELATKTTEVKFWDKGRQLELAAKHLGMLDGKGSDGEEEETTSLVFNLKDSVGDVRITRGRVKIK